MYLKHQPMWNKSERVSDKKINNRADLFMINFGLNYENAL